VEEILWKVFADIIALKTIDSCFYFLARQERKMGVGGSAPGKFLESHRFTIEKRPF